MIVDTNVLLDVLNDDPAWVDWSLQQLNAQSQVHRLAINAVIYAELSLSFSCAQALDDTVTSMQLVMLDIPKPALFLAGKAFAQYRRRGGTKSNVLSDFFIGAHAAVSGLPILTRDTSRYSSYFPTVRLVAP
ncbi:MAG: type II toxin-antitoxin system VapC family toxin [Pseudomonadota bacterium]|nr:type II toxin-antitoxin system VapC family toxin [Pseudomonadota bacterium]